MKQTDKKQEEIHFFLHPLLPHINMDRVDPKVTRILIAQLDHRYKFLYSVLHEMTAKYSHHSILRAANSSDSPVLQFV